jgi:hypothetical protein
MHIVKFSASLGALMLGSVTLAQTAFAINVTPVAAPEISPASAMAAITLLVGSIVVLRGRRRAE